MKQYTILILLAVLFLPACKTSEENYRAAYELATKNKTQDEPDDAALDEENVQWTEYVTFEEKCGGKREDVKKYMVIVGQFKQLFNAKALRNRLAENGYENAVVVRDGKTQYYVSACSFDTKEDAENALKKVAADKNVPSLSPLPKILEKA